MPPQTRPKNRPKPSSRQRTRRQALLVAAALLLLPPTAIAAIALDVWLFSRQDSAANADAALVLGAAAWGPKPSPVFRERLRHAADLYHQGRVETVLISGGVGKGGGPSEAQVGRDFLLDLGIPPKALLTEDRSSRTVENIVHSKAIARREGIRTFLLVSDPLHMRRATALAQAQGLKTYPSPTRTSAYKSDRPNRDFWIRETINMAALHLGHP